jgi:hypothetical protein
MPTEKETYQMKSFGVAAIVVLGLGAAYGQTQPTVFERQPFPTDNRPLSGEEWRLKLAEHLLSFPSPVKHGAIQLRGMGDEAAVDLLKILEGKNSLTVSKSEAALDIIHMAFEQPDSIIDPANKTPQATTLLLQYISAKSSDSAVQQRVIIETAFVRAAVISFSAVTR